MGETGIKKGKLITLEGIEGVGKTTHLKTIQAFLNSHGIANQVSREPGGTPLGENIRSWLLSSDNKPTEATELCLLFADRAEHINKVLRPTLKSGQWIISDRFTDASIAYQGGGRGIPLDIIHRLSEYVCRDLRPDLTLLFDVSVETACERVAKRSRQDRFEMEDAVFFQRVQNAYYELMEKEPERWKRVDSSRPINEVKKRIENILSDFIENLK